MAKNSFLDWDTTASNNTDIGGTGIQGTNAVSNFDNAFRTIMAQLRSGVDGEVVYSAKSANYTAVANDNNGVLRFTAAATLSLTAAATLANGWHVLVMADGGNVTIDPNGAETIDGLATRIIYDGQAVLISCSGTDFRSVVIPGISGTGGISLYGTVPRIRLTDTDTNAECYLSGSSAAGSLILQADVGNAVASSTISFQVDGTFVGAWDTTALEPRVNIVPDTNNTRSLGSATTKFANADLGGTLFATASTAGTVPDFSLTAGTAGAWVSATGFVQAGRNNPAGLWQRSSSDGNLHLFYRGTSGVGSISVTTTATAFNTSSSKTRKENWRAFDAGAIIDGIEAWLFDWKSGGSAYGVLAQDVVEVFPDAVTVDEDPDKWAVDYSKFVPLLLREVKSLRARLAALETA